jgi:hypothetical protein
VTGCTVHQAQCSAVKVVSSVALCSRSSPELVSSHFIPLLVQTGANDPSAVCRRAECESVGIKAESSTETAVSQTQNERLNRFFTVLKS